MVKNGRLEPEKLNEIEKSIILKAVINFPERTDADEFEGLPNEVLHEKVEKLQKSEPKIVEESKHFTNGQLINYSVNKNLVSFLSHTKENLNYKEIHNFSKEYLKKRCESLYGQFSNRILENRKIKTKVAIGFVIILAIFYSMIAVLLNYTIYNPISIGYLVFGIILNSLISAFFIKPNSKKQEKIRLKEKENFIYTLTKVSKLVESYTNDTNIRHIRDSRREINYFLKSVFAVPISLGYVMDEKIIQFYHLLELFLKKKILKILDTKRSSDELIPICYQLKKIAVMLDEEKIIQSVEYLKQFNLEDDKPSKYRNFLNKFINSDISNWIFAIMILIILIVVSVFVANQFGVYEEDVTLNTYSIAILIVGSIPTIYILKKIVDKIMTQLIRKSKS